MTCEPKIIDTGVDALLCDALQKPAPYYCKAYPQESRPGCWNTNRMVVIERETEKEVGEYVYTYSSPGRTFHPFKLRGSWYALYSTQYTAIRVMSLPDCKDLGGEDPQCAGFCPVDFWVPPLHYIEVHHYEECPWSKPSGGRSGCTCRLQHRTECPKNPESPVYKADWNDPAKRCICKEENDAFWKFHHEWKFPERIYGFVAGCVWGDDGSWKIEYLDLSQVDEGIIKREAKFGYISMPEDLNLSQAIHFGMDDEDGPYNIKIDVMNRYRFETGKLLEM